MKLRIYISLIIFLSIVSSCSFTKYVPDGKYLLDKVTVETEGKDIPPTVLKSYLRQTPNAKVFGTFSMQLGIYSLSGNDSTKWLNRFLRRVGSEPVIYDPYQTELSVQQLQQMLNNRGFMNNNVQSRVVTKGKKATVVYAVKFNQPYTIRKYNIDLQKSLSNEAASDSLRTLVRKNMLFDSDVLNAERERVSSRLRQQGYFNFSKEYINYSADSTLNSHQVDVNMELKEAVKHSADSINHFLYRKYVFGKVHYQINTDGGIVAENTPKVELDTTSFRDFQLIGPGKHSIRLDALVQNTYINPKNVYSDRAVERTYSALNSLGAVKYVTISFREVQDSVLDCYIVVTPAKPLTVSMEVEGTYTNGYKGVGGSVSTVHHNAFGGAESLSFQGRLALEWQEDVLAQEWGGQIGLKLPKFVSPIGSYDFKRNIHANTGFTTTINYQYRPGEFKTLNFGAGMNYSWSSRQFYHSFQLLDLSYVHFPWISDAFKDRFLNVNPPIFNPYNYLDHFIMRMGYSGSFTNAVAARPLQNFSTGRYSIEMAGNLLYGLNIIGGSKKETDNSYRFLGIRYAQFVKGEYNYVYNQIFDKNSRLVYHAGVGLGVPYGNASVIPYEKRFFSGGANSVRGWGEGTLGPGVYKRINISGRDYNQVGDIKLDLNLEYRVKMFWRLEGALFADAGNVWTIKDYETQQNGVFRFDTFAKQVGLAYGAGLRFDFSFFVFRFDLGLKLYDPVRDSNLWRTKPTSDDLAFHLGIGYPF